MHAIPGLYYKITGVKGRGVFCTRDIHEGDLIEVCPVIVLNDKDLKIIQKTRLHDYYFAWGEDGKQCAIALGYGSLYNHSKNPNAQFRPDLSNETIDFISIKDIPEGKEINVDYHEGIKKKEDLWFDVK